MATGNEIEPASFARALAQLYRTEQLVCSECGASFVGRALNRGKGRYCGQRCKWTATNRTRAERKRTTKEEQS